eukprot:246711-Pelagomonas_calceolata.AAC.3
MAVLRRQQQEQRTCCCAVLRHHGAVQKLHPMADPASRLPFIETTLSTLRKEIDGTGGLAESRLNLQTVAHILLAGWHWHCKQWHTLFSLADSGMCRLCCVQCFMR